MGKKKRYSRRRRTLPGSNHGLDPTRSPGHSHSSRAIDPELWKSVTWRWFLSDPAQIRRELGIVGEFEDLPRENLRPDLVANDFLRRARELMDFVGDGRPLSYYGTLPAADMRAEAPGRGPSWDRSAP